MVQFPPPRDPRTDMTRGRTPPGQTSRGRQSQADNGTIALAISSMTMYWFMPLLAKRKKRRKPSSQQ